MPKKRSPEFVKDILLELLIECPRDDHSENCLLYDKRDLSLSDKLEWAMSLPADELHGLFTAHLECLKAKDVVQPRVG